MNAAKRKRAFTALLIIIGCLYMYTVFSKKNTAAPIYLFMHNKSAKFATADSQSNRRFWDNYPYQVLASEHEPIDLPSHIITQINPNNNDPIQRFMNQPQTLYFRYYYSTSNESINKHLLELLSKTSFPVLVLADARSKNHLDLELNKFKKNEMLLTAMISDLPIELENVKVSYFFKIGEQQTITDLFVPRLEIPQVTDKYIEKNL